MASWEEFSRIVAEAKAAKKLDPVGQEDDDVDNDGDSDSSDSYLKKRRATVGAAIAADKKKKVEEALDPVGKEDKDIDNDGDHDKSDSYLLNRRKVRAKVIPPQERLKTDRDMFNIPKSEQEAARERTLAKAKAKREKMKEETEQLDEFLGTGRVVAGKSQAGYNPGSRFTQAGTVQKVFGVKVPGSFKPGASESDVARHNKAASPQSQIKKTNLSNDQLLGKKPGGQVTVGITPDKKSQTAAPKPAAAPDKKPTFAEKGREMRRQIDASNAALTQAINQSRGINNSYQPEGEMVEEDKEYRREMAKAAARERAEEKKEKGKKAAKIPGRLGISSGTSYADKQELSIKGHDKVTKKAKHTVGNPFPEEYAVDGEYIEEMPYQVYGSHDGKTEKKIGKPVKSRKYAHDRADELSDTHKETGGKFRVQKEEIETIEEKALSRAQQRFMGMVYAAKKGATPASPEVAKAASGMSKKAAKDFAKTKHEGLPEKKEEVKEELSLVQRIIAEATDAQWMAAKARRDEREKEQRRRMKQAKLNTAAVKAMKDESKRNENNRDESKSKRGKSALTGAERAEAIRTAGRVKTAKIYQQIEREKRLEKKEREKRESEEEKKKTKKRQRRELRSDIKSALSSPIKVSASEKDTDVASAVMSNVGSLAGSVAKVGGALAKYGVKRALTKRQERKESQSKEKETQKEQFYNWREEFIFEVDDQSVQNEKQKVIDVSKKKNKIEINPNMSEGCGCEDKEKMDEKPKKDMRDLPTKVNLLKTKARAMGARNPIVMVASEETDNIQEIAPLLAGVARLAGGAVARGVTSRVAGSAAQGTLRSKAAQFIGKKTGEKIATMFTTPPESNQSTPSGEEEPLFQTKLEKQLKTEGAAWTKKEGKSEAGGLNEKGRKSYERENPGSDLKAPSKKVGNPRRASFCARMSGMKAKLTSKKTANDPDSRINKSLRAWNC